MLDRAPGEPEKSAALEGYFRSAPPADAAWALWFLTGRQRQRLVKCPQLRQWASEVADLPAWLVDECVKHVGDVAETLALLLPPPCAKSVPALTQLVTLRLLPLAGLSEAAQRDLLRAAWTELDVPERHLWHQLITGGFRAVAPPALLARALAQVAGIEPPVMAYRLAGEWRPIANDFGRLLRPAGPEDAVAMPKPFAQSAALSGEPGKFGDAAAWLVEWAWPGLRAQLVRRASRAEIWSENLEILTAVLPEIVEASHALPEGTVLDGELLAWRGDRARSFAELQRRLNRRAASPTLRREVPVVFLARDLLESDGRDWRQRPLAERRDELEKVLRGALATWTSQTRTTDTSGVWQGELFGVNSPTPEAAPRANLPLRLPASLTVSSWDDVAKLQQQARAMGAEGLLLRRLDSPYVAGREHGAWRRWEVAPLTCCAVLVAAQADPAAHEARFTRFTFSVWRGDALVPVAQIRADVDDHERATLDAFVRANTTGRFGPVRIVKPELVFELAFEGVHISKRHKAGLTLHQPRIVRLRPDKQPAAAGTVDSLLDLAGA